MFEFSQFDQINPLTGEGYPTGEQPPPSNDPPPTVARENWQKKNHPPEIEKKIIGVVDAILCPAAPGNPAVTVSKFDTTTYIDRAIVQLYNNTGGASELGNFSIKGKLVYQISNASSGRSGSLIWEHTDYGDIEKYGEKEMKVANEFIFSGAQVEDIGDFTKKEMKPHDMYTLGLRGFHPYFEVGDLWTLTINHSLPASTSEQELIDVDVQVRGVSYQKNAKGIAETILSVRVPSGAWSKTTSTRAKVAVSGLPNQGLSRAEEITIAPSDNPGQAMYHCTGTNDELVIQSAIDKLGASGGGTIILLKGNFYLQEQAGHGYALYINHPGIQIVGCGYGSTILNFDGSANSISYGIYMHASDCVLRDFHIYTSDYTYLDFSVFSDSTITQCLIQNVKASGADAAFLLGQMSNSKVEGCILSSRTFGINMYGIGNSILNNIITIADTYTTTIGIISTGDTEIIAGNIITITGDGSDKFVGITKGSGTNGVMITGNKIYINGTFTNTIQANAINIHSNEANAIITGNNIQISGTISIGSTDAAIKCFSDRNTISNNNILFNGTFTVNTGQEYTALYVLNGADDVLVSGNMVIGKTINCAGGFFGIAFNGARNQLIGNVVRLFVNAGAGEGKGIWTMSSATYGMMVGNVTQNNDTNWDNDGSVSVNSGNLYA